MSKTLPNKIIAENADGPRRKFAPPQNALSLLLIAFIVSCSTHSQPRSFEAAPMIAVLEAAKSDSVKTFKNAYSKRIQGEDAQSDWTKNLKEAKENMRRLYGDYQLRDFAFAFDGDAVKGKLAISFKGTKPFDLAVIKGDGEWKLDER
jgi:hypothetical protein